MTLTQEERQNINYVIKKNIQIGNELSDRIQNLYFRNGITLQHPWIPCTLAGVGSEMHEIFGCPLLGLW
jgi:hypothetical protein